MRLIIIMLIVGMVLTSGCLRQPLVNDDEQIVQTVGFEEAGVPARLETIRAKENLSRVKVAFVYQSVTDSEAFNRTLDDVIKIFKETNTDFIFRGFWKWRYCPGSCSELSPEYVSICEEYGYSYKQLNETITKIKEENPDVIFCGAIPAQRLNKMDSNPITGEKFRQEDTWNMALDPGKWDIDLPKQDFQKNFAIFHSWIELGQEYDPETAACYFPDITNPEFQELILSWAKKQIDCGADAIWIDMLFMQVYALATLTNDSTHPSVTESFEASSKIVDEIHKYSESKEKYVYVGTWWTFNKLSYNPPNVDFVTATFSAEEVLNKKPDADRWEEIKSKVEGKLGNVPIFVFIDYGQDELAMAAFSQNLSKEDQREFLKIADKFFQKKGIHFVYPVHGGFMGNSATILSFGRLGGYDSIAPEFATYEIIVELAMNKSKNWDEN